MNKINTNISVDPDLKKKAIELFNNFGLDFSTAISLFLSQSVREKRIPFEITMDIPNEETIEALNEFPKMRAPNSKYKRYNTFKEILKDLK